MIVIDASTLAKYLLKEQNWLQIEEYLKKTPHAPTLIVKEVCNALWKHTAIHQKLSKTHAKTLYNALMKLIQAEIVVLEPQENYLEQAFEIALSENTTIYDAIYLAQAAKLGQLLTSDKQQERTARKLGIPTIFI